MRKSPKESWQVWESTWALCHLTSRVPPSSLAKKKGCTAGWLSTTWWETSWRWVTTLKAFSTTAKEKTTTYKHALKSLNTFHTHLVFSGRKTCGTPTFAQRGKRPWGPWISVERPHRLPLPSRRTTGGTTTCTSNSTATRTTSTLTASCATARTRPRRRSWIKCWG